MCEVCFFFFLSAGLMLDCIGFKGKETKMLSCLLNWLGRGRVFLDKQEEEKKTCWPTEYKNSLLIISYERCRSETHLGS